MSRRNEYGRYGEDEEKPEWFEEWRRDRIASVRLWERKRERLFLDGVAVVLARKPCADLAAARGAIEAAQDAGEVIGYPLGRDLWLARRLERIGFVFPVADRTRPAAVVTEKEWQLIEAWASERVRRGVDRPQRELLETLADDLCRWGWRTDELAAVDIGARKLAQWLTESGFEPVRTAAGRAFCRIALRRP